MKYIKTNDGVYEATDILEDGSCWCLNNGGKYFIKSDIIKESEDLTELCDEFVIDDKRNNVHYLMDYYDVIEEIELIYEKYVVYGAIWCEFGLKYIAKLNSKVGLELL